MIMNRGGRAYLCMSVPGVYSRQCSMLYPNNHDTPFQQSIERQIDHNLATNARLAHRSHHHPSHPHISAPPLPFCRLSVLPSTIGSMVHRSCICFSARRLRSFPLFFFFSFHCFSLISPPFLSLPFFSPPIYLSLHSLRLLSPFTLLPTPPFHFSFIHYTDHTLTTPFFHHSDLWRSPFFIPCQLNSSFFIPQLPFYDDLRRPYQRLPHRA